MPSISAGLHGYRRFRGLLRRARETQLLPAINAESFVKTIKRDYVAHMPKPDRETALRNLAIAFEHFNGFVGASP
ncbi:hypothetical protein LOY37_13070 [Pseudomonas sp. B21-012]|uniref:hypothetical protein n=1 Tax=Pseudomonas sp. B21-012 TaxID=2895472 RepID=UPI000F9A0E64|nr:hypothetical protein [Pseudomonas sp. B21-012]UVM58722.1 hypothetical protein LOY37_13070 [Pseudomonas sp. B21-012]